ncbi:MAG: ribonuclease G [Candidatus Azotimanducaceae bacterium]|jgi:ribonuclease G|tara:strand:- start:6031 stop:7551 length:1521 start_codon:yes stop_codon:yes gene_type:complete
MSEELLINVSSFETRVALIANGALQEIHMARSNGYSATGNIYLGKVVRIVPGMQAAFVDIGLERPGFLHASDIQSSLLLSATAPASAVSTKSKPNIRSLLHDGQNILVQVSKDPLGQKGPRLTTRIAIAAKFLVLTPYEKHVGISQRIEDESERTRLYRVLGPLVDKAGIGVIARTLSDGAEDHVLLEDFALLQRIWSTIQGDLKKLNPPNIVYAELPVENRLIRDLVGNTTERIAVDDAATLQQIREYMQTYAPEYLSRLFSYQDQIPIFQRYAVDGEITRALEPTVRLPNGGSLVIEQTEALVSIDVNTSGFVGGADLEETVFRTNLEAAQSIPRQLRLRNLGGIIVIDFIDMLESKHRQQVLQALKEGLAMDPCKTFCDEFSQLGLVLMSRKRTRKSLEQTVCVPCDNCSGSGSVVSAESTCMEILREIFAQYSLSDAPGKGAGEYTVIATEAVIERFLDEDAKFLAQLSATLKCSITLQNDPAFAVGHFAIRFSDDSLRRGS